MRRKTRKLLHERRSALRIGKQANCVFKSMRGWRRSYLTPDEFFSCKCQVNLHRRNTRLCSESFHRRTRASIGGATAAIRPNAARVAFGADLGYQGQTAMLLEADRV